MSYKDDKPRDGCEVRKAFPTPADLEKLVDEYIESTENATCIESVRFAHSIEKVERPAMVSIYNFCRFAKIDSDTLGIYRKKANYFGIIVKLCDYIYDRATMLHDNGIMSARSYAKVTARAKEYEAEKEQTDNGNAKQIIVTFGAESVQIDHKPVDTSVSGENIDFDDDDDKIIKGITPNRKEKY